MCGYVTFCLSIQQLLKTFFSLFGYYDIHVHVFAWTHIFISLWYIARNGIVGSYGKFMFNCLKSCQTFFQSSAVILHSYQQGMRVLISLHPQQHLLLSDFFYFSHPTRSEVVSHCGFDLHIPD